MKIDIVISDRKHPLWTTVSNWAERHQDHQINLLNELAQAEGGDFLVMIACHEIAKPAVRGRYRRSFVSHASDLPEGRGWSPAVWDILEGKDRIVLTLIEATDQVDAGGVLHKFRASVKPTDLHDDINRMLGELVLGALDFILKNADMEPVPQTGNPTWHRKRAPADSELDPSRSIASQFNLLRVCDPDRYPAFFELFGERFELIIRKSSRVRSS
jgi:methionyl-tRNA formyltransferase